MVMTAEQTQNNLKHNNSKDLYFNSANACIYLKGNVCEMYQIIYQNPYEIKVHSQL